jgi:hypothetical protein
MRAWEGARAPQEALDRPRRLRRDRDSRDAPVHGRVPHAQVQRGHILRRAPRAVRQAENDQGERFTNYSCRVIP